MSDALNKMPANGRGGHHAHATAAIDSSGTDPHACRSEAAGSGSVPPAALPASTAALLAYVDTQECYRFVNPAYAAWLELPADRIVGRRIGEIAGISYLSMQPHIAAALRGESVEFTLAVEHPTKGQRLLAIVHTPDISPSGVVAGFHILALDIIGPVTTRLGAPPCERRARPAMDGMPIFIAQCDHEYRLRFVNKTYVERYGIDPNKLIGQRIPDLVGDDAFASFRQYIDAALAGKVQDLEIRLPTPESGDHYVHMTYVPECDDDGEVRGLITAFSDTSRLRRAEDQLYRRELEFKTLVENSPDVISRIDRAMRHVYVNPAIEAAFGKPASAYLGKTKAELGFPPEVVQAWDRAAHAAFASGSEQRFHCELDLNGETRHFATRLIPEPERDGAVESLLCVTYDVTERTRMEHERDELLTRERNARIQAETAARARDEFLAIVSHELRAPLNGIQSWTHVLENYVKDLAAIPLAQRALQGIRTGVAQQVRLIEDLLDVTRMMSGKMRLAKQPLALLPAIQAAVDSVRDAASAKRISLTCDYRITSEQINGDADRVQQIIWNLLSNAIKFTPEGGHVRLAVTRSERDACITVNDDGIGISPDFLPHLFDRFSQEDTSSTRDHSGLGLGLFLVRHLIELHGGSISAHSAGEAEGTTFSVRLPLRTPDKYIPATRNDEQLHTPLALPSLDGLRVLLIDDQEEARESLTAVLSTVGAGVFAAPSSKEALTWLSTLSIGEMPDILICDIAMPGEDGYAVLRKLRAWRTANNFAPLKRLPALALTAFSQREDRIRALTAGFQMHITKPVAPEELIVVIATMVPHG
jgi:PAS domain S-box-containing protein